MHSNAKGGLVGITYKYFRYYNRFNPDNFFTEQLYNVIVDPYEVQNLPNNPEKAGLKDEMIRKMKRMRTELR